MQQRRSATGRPSGTDGSDYSYRMVVDSRYTKVAKRKSRLAQILLLQVVIVLFDILLIVLPVIKGDDPNTLAISSAAVCFVSLILGECGRRYSRSPFLKIYLFLSLVAVLLSIAIAVKSDLLLEAFRDGLASSGEKQIVQIIEGARVFLCNFLLLVCFSLIWFRSSKHVGVIDFREHLQECWSSFLLQVPHCLSSTTCLLLKDHLEPPPPVVTDYQSSSRVGSNIFGMFLLT